MNKTLFEYRDYKEYLNSALTIRGVAGRGERTRLAEFIGCHTGYISQVLRGGAHLSLEQAEAVTRFFGHNQNQAKYFLSLVQFNRAGTESLRSIFEKNLNELTEKQYELKQRLGVKKSLSPEDQSRFYSSWHYGAIHVLVSLPSCHTERGISAYLGIPIEKVSEVLQFLTEVGLVVLKDEQYQIGTTHIHLERESPMIAKHHTNWRLQAIQSLDNSQSKDLHYSSVITASHNDSVRIREILVRAIEEVRATVRGSKDEACYAYSVDFFGLRKNV